MSPTVIGIDLSLTSTGLCIVYKGKAQTFRVESKGSADASLANRYRRLDDIAGEIIMTVVNNDADLVVIEQPAYSRTVGHMHDRSGLWWIVVHALHHERHSVAEVAPTSRARYATGKGNAGKDAVLLEVARRFPDVALSGNDEADALVLAAMGADYLACPIVTMPASHREALGKVRWPEVATQ